MAKKQTHPQDEEELRQSRKEILRARKEAEQTRQIRLAVAGVAGLLLIVLLVAVVNEFFIAPNQVVATVNGEEITVRQWQERVRYERAQRIIALENQYEAFDGDVGIIQQFSLQTIQELLDNEALAEGVLNQMADEALIRQEATAKGITITEADIDQEIGSFFNYFGGESPTPAPTPTETVAPTPSLTPIPTPVITDVVPTNTPFPTLTPGPTEPPPPTATPVSQESFGEQLNETLTQFRDLGVNEEIFREVVRTRLFQNRLADALAKEVDMPTEAPHTSLYLLSFDTEADANEAVGLIQESDFLTVWNTIRSRPPDPDAETTTTATELLWRTQDAIITALGEQAGEVAFTLPPNVPSAAIEQQADAATVRYHIIQVSGREVRELPESTLESARRQLLVNLVDEKAASSIELTERWRSRIPTQPLLDPKFLAQPTATPLAPGIETNTDDGHQ